MTYRRLNKQRDNIQREAVKKWIDKGKIGTCEIITGLGKTFIALHCLLSMPKDDKIHLFLAETTAREKDLNDDIEKYNEIFDVDIRKDYNLQFHCYQTVYKWKDKDFGLVIADELHDSLSPSYSKFYGNNKYDAIIGLSATIQRDTWYGEEGNRYNKGHLLDKIAPIVYSYNINQGQKDNTARKLDVHIIGHELNAIDKTVVSGNKKNPFMQSEKDAYDYWHKQFVKALYIEDEAVKSFKLRITSHKRSKILYDMKSKVSIVKKILPTLQGRTIVFGNSLDRLLDITKNVVSSRNKDDRNDLIREKFEKGEIDVIGSFKKLKQGANLKGLDNCIIMSFYSTEKDLIQRLGRLRKDDDKIGKVFIIVTRGTKEMDWYKKMFENIDVFNIKSYDSINEYLKTR